MALSDYLSTKVATGPSHQSLSKDYSSQYAQVVSVITNINQIDTKLDIVNKIYGEADVNVDYVDKNTLLYGINVKL